MKLEDLKIGQKVKFHNNYFGVDDTGVISKFTKKRVGIALWKDSDYLQYVSPNSIKEIISEPLN